MGVAINPVSLLDAFADREVTFRVAGDQLLASVRLGELFDGDHDLIRVNRSASTTPLRMDPDHVPPVRLIYWVSTWGHGWGWEWLIHSMPHRRPKPLTSPPSCVAQVTPPATVA